MTSALRARIEPFGAWVAVDDSTLVAIDRRRARAMGIDGGVVWSDPESFDTRGPTRAPLELHVAVTSRCPVSCSGCYQNASPEGEHVPFATLERTLSEAARAGVITVAFGGGEPLTHPELPEIGRLARRLGLVPVVTISGIGLTEARAKSLDAFAQVNVSHDGVSGGYQAVRGFDGATTAERAIALLTSAGIAVGANVVLTRQSFGSHGEPLIATCERLASLGVREAQLLRYKPRGRAASLTYLATRLSPAQVDALPRAIAAIVERGELSVRIDCSMLPLLSTSLTDAAMLERQGVMGCEAGGLLGATNVGGNVAGCSFVDATSMRADELSRAWRDTLDLDMFRTFRAHAPEPCCSCPIAPICKGGCKVVRDHAGLPPDAPDPECPRVMDHARRAPATLERAVPR